MPTAVNSPEDDLSKRFALVALAGFVLASFAVRMWLLHTAMAAGGFNPGDADGYFRNARLLGQEGAGWRWTLDAINYPWDGRPYLLPPLYPVFLSLFVVAADSFQYWALVGQAALNAASAASLYVIGTSLHSRRAGLIGAAVFAFWLPNIWTYALFMQEQLYVPLLMLAFALFLRSTATAASWKSFACAGAAFGLAALTRSMPLYFVIPAALGHVVLTRDRKSVTDAAALLGGFFAVTGLYSVWLSWQVGQFVYIENHAGISVHNYGAARGSGVPAHSDIITELSDAFFTDPRAFVGLWWSYTRALFHVHGDRWLHFYQATTAAGAATAKAMAHLGIDLPFIASVILAPLGAVFARRPREAALLVFWVVLVVVLTALSATGGVRYRSPFEPHLVALAAVALAGAWRRPGRLALISALAISAVAASVLIPQVPRVARARANYGIQESADADGVMHFSVVGRAGLNVLPKDGVIELRLSSPQPARVSFWIDRHPVADRTVSDEPLRVRFVGSHPGVHYVEVNAIDEAGQPVRLAIDMAPISVVSYGS